MSESSHSREHCVFTIGHSNHTFEAFVDLLKEQEIGVLVDVRSQPYSKYTPHFDHRNLQAALTGQGFKYIYLGKELGGRPDGAGYYDAEGHVLYSRLADSPAFLQGIERLVKGIQQYRVAIMCSEEDPAECHRRLLICRVLEEKGIIIEHIRGNGALEEDPDPGNTDPNRGRDSRQLPLFMSEEKPEWKSTRSASRKEQPKNSSRP